MPLASEVAASSSSSSALLRRPPAARVGGGCGVIEGRRQSQPAIRQAHLGDKIVLPSGVDRGRYVFSLRQPRTRCIFTESTMHFLPHSDGHQAKKMTLRKERKRRRERERERERRRGENKSYSISIAHSPRPLFWWQQQLAPAATS
jgi:hypothetical protein